MEIKMATLEDSRGISDIHVKSWQYAYKGIMPDSFLEALDINQRIEAWNSVLSDKRWPAYVAVDNTGSIQGFVHLCRCRDEDLDNDIYGEVTAVYISPTLVGKGIGAKLFMKADCTLKGRGLLQSCFMGFAGKQTGYRFLQEIWI